jgi:hypothetical protein
MMRAVLAATVCGLIAGAGCVGGEDPSSWEVTAALGPAADVAPEEGEQCGELPGVTRAPGRPVDGPGDVTWQR